MEISRQDEKESLLLPSVALSGFSKSERKYHHVVRDRRARSGQQKQVRRREVYQYMIMNPLCCWYEEE